MAIELSHAVRGLLSMAEPERMLGAYRLKRQLGRGGFAPVWLAEEVCADTTLRLAAVKLFALDPQPRRGRSAAAQAIVDEARRLCQVEHPNIVRFYALPVDEARGVAGLAMEYIAGEALSERLRARGPLPVGEVLEIGAAMASALAAVHEAGLVHRDLSPANILVASSPTLGGPFAYKLIDFGIAAALPDSTSGDRRPSAARARQKLGGDLPEELGGTRLSQVPDAIRLPPEDAADLAGPLTRVGGKLGYVDPVCWRELSPATSASDLYGLGAVLFVCMAGRIPAAGTGALRGEVLDGRARAPRLAEVAPETPPELDRLVDALLDPDPARRPRSAELVAIELERLRGLELGRKPVLPPEDEGPFRGLERFELTHRDIFFGRRAEIAATLEALRSRGLVALVGPSGSGKSSLARAGVLPAIADGVLGGPRQWDTAVVTPGLDPRNAIGAALFHMDLDMSRTPAEVVAGIAEWTLREGRGLCLLVDQLEELATLALAGDAHAESRRWTIELLARLGERQLPGLRALVTARRDLLDPILAHSDLGRVILRGAVLVAPIDDAAWGEVVDAALATYGYDFEDAELRRGLLDELHGTARAMPLVEFALTRLWAERDRKRRQITRESMRAVGGIAGALERYAEATFERALAENLSPTMLRRLLLSLTTPDGTRATRSIESLLELGAGDEPEVRTALAHLDRARLLVRERGGVALAHDALLTQWERLRAWLAEVQQDRLLAERVERAAAHWAEDPSDHDLLWRGRSLSAGEDLARRGGVTLSATAGRFLAAGLRNRKRRRIALGALAAGVAAALLGAAVKYVGDIRAETARAESARQEALRQQELAESARQEAVEQKERAEKDEKELEVLKRKVDEEAFRYYSALRSLAQVLASKEDAEALLKLQARVRDLPEEMPPAGAPPPPSEQGLLEVIEEMLPEGAVAPVPIEQPGEPGQFNLGAAYAALHEGALRARACGARTGPRGLLRLGVVFRPDGQVEGVVAPGTQGTEVGRCIEGAFLGIRVPPFRGSPITAPKTVRIP